MLKYEYEDFENHLENVCKDELLKEYALDFYSCLQAQNQTLKKSDFEKLIVKDIDGTPKLLEQDIVKELFAKKDEAKLEEVFTYLFCNNLEKFDYKIGPSFENFNAYFDASKKQLIIHINEDELKSEQAKAKHKVIINHELAHILELKSFENRKIMYLGLCNNVYVKDFPDEVFLLNSNHTLNLRKVNPNNKEWLKYIGSTALSEVNNDFYSVKIANKTVFTENKFNKLFEQYFQNKTYGALTCKNIAISSKYCKNYDMISLLNFAVGNDIFSKNKFNAVNFINKINNLKVDDNLISGIEEILKDMEVDKINNSSIYSLLTINLGIAKEQEDMKKFDNFIYFKSLNQQILINAIKNNILNQLDNPLTRKDFSFFVNLDEMLIDINSILIFDKKDPNNFSGPSGEFRELLEEINYNINTLPTEEKEIAKEELLFLREYKKAISKKENCNTASL